MENSKIVVAGIAVNFSSAGAWLKMVGINLLYSTRGVAIKYCGVLIGSLTRDTNAKHGLTVFTPEKENYISNLFPLCLISAS